MKHINFYLIKIAKDRDKIEQDRSEIAKEFDKYIRTFKIGLLFPFMIIKNLLWINMKSLSHLF